MGADGHLTLARIGDGQCWINENLPQIKIEEATAVFLREAEIWCEQPKRIYTYNADIYVSMYQPDYEERVIRGHYFRLGRRWGHKGIECSAVEGEFSLAWCSIDWLQTECPPLFNQHKKPRIFGVPAQEHIDAWEKLVPGVWVPTLYIRYGRGSVWNGGLDKRCEIKDEVTWEVWT